MKLLLVEPEATGHRMALYTRFIAREAAKRRWQVSLMTTPHAQRHSAFSLVKSECNGHLAVVPMQAVTKRPGRGPIDLMLLQNRYYEAIANSYRRIPLEELPDVIYIVNLDNLDKVLALRGTPFGKTAFSGMMMSIKYHRQAMGIGPRSRSDRGYEYLFRRLLRLPMLRSATVVDEVFLEFVRSRSSWEYGKLRFVPDIGQLTGSETREDARRALKIPPGKTVVLVYGGLTGRKGVAELIRAVEAGTREDVAILLAGTQQGDVERLLDQPSARALSLNGQLIQSKGFHSEEGEYRVFRAADIVWIGYVEGFTSSSGVLYQACAARLPVIATKHGLIGWLTKRHEIGITVDPKDTQTVITAIDKLTADPELYALLANNGLKVARVHTAESFGSRVCDALVE